MKRFKICLLSALMLVCFSVPAWAIGISSVKIDSSNNIAIDGIGFGTKPQVFFGSPVPNMKVFAAQKLTPSVQTLSTTDQRITASLTSLGTITPGTYEVIVKNPVIGTVAKYEVTYGAASNGDIGALNQRFTNFSTSNTAALKNYSTELNNETTRAEGAEANELPLSGGTLTGALTLAGDPTSNMQAATKQYADAAAKTAAKPDPATMQAALLQWYSRTVALGTEPYAVAFDGVHVWVTNYNDNTVSEIDPSTATVINNFSVGKNPSAVAFDGMHVWVTNYNDNTVSEIDPSTATVVKIVGVGNGPDGVTFDGTHVWVTNSGDKTVSKIDPSSATVINTVNVGYLPYGMAFDGTHVWVTNYGDKTVSEIDTSTATVINTVNVGTYPNGAAFDGTHVWVVNYGDSTVSEIDPTTATVINTVTVGGSPYGLAFDGAHVWVTNWGSNSVTEIPTR